MGVLVEELLAEETTGLFCRPLAPVSMSPGSFAVLPCASSKPPRRSMPSNTDFSECRAREVHAAVKVPIGPAQKYQDRRRGSHTWWVLLVSYVKSWLSLRLAVHKISAGRGSRGSAPAS